MRNVHKINFIWLTKSVLAIFPHILALDSNWEHLRLLLYGVALIDYLIFIKPFAKFSKFS